jgi:ribonuclease HII
MLIAGIDDAGRGAVIGPLIIAGVLVDERGLERIEALGVRDSKTLTPNRRQTLAEEILKVVKDHCIVALSPAEIDHVVKTGKKLHRLNRLEAKAMAEVINKLKPHIAYIDASDVLPERFSRHVAEELSFGVKIVSEHKADRTYPVVSAASIIAKVERDRVISDLRRRYGDLGSGYASDRRTIKFLEEWMRTHDDYPDFVRRSWAPAKRIKAAYDRFQSRL